MAIGLVLLILVLGIGGWLMSTYNGMVKSRNLVAEGFSTMDVYLKKRWDLIPNLVETVKGYAKHEEGVLKELTSLRASSYDSMSADEKIDLNQKLSGAINKIIAVAENYPDLKASTNFGQLQNDLNKIEEDIAQSRKYYNGTVRDYNNLLQVFPNNLIAGIFGFHTEKMFEAAAAERENVKVSFD